MAFIDTSDKPMLIMTKNGIKPIEVIKSEYDKNSGRTIIKEYKEIKKPKSQTM